MKPVIETTHLTKQFKVKKKSGQLLKDLFRPEYQDVIAVDDISFSLEEGESVAFVGPNGAGKTTTTKMLCGLVYPTRGDISVLGYFPFDRNKNFLEQIGLVMGSKAGLNWDLTPNQSFDLLRQIYQIPDNDFKQRVGILTELLSAEKFLGTQVRKLSLGERMKMELIGSILHKPKVLFLDEPTIGLDIISRQKTRKFLRQIQKEFKTTMLLTSHDMADVETVCDRVIIINSGKIVYDNALAALMEQYRQTRYVKFIFHQIPSPEEIKVGFEAKIVQTGENYYTYEVKHTLMPQLITAISQNFKLVDIDILSIPLEEIIADIFRNTT
ncbi:ATP-binding cassette domain-containing protein [Patescibacteria group bacterium]|nr:ATP-binding cassette domain-containing protein [Patescibacteria group bacterium]